ncbi:MAG: response regulator [Muribaculaceae bacterium]|nr:response regulator [Muribaculaceae bacterium]
MHEKEHERLMAERKEFFASFTHELCSPLTMIMGVCETLNKLSDSPEYRDLKPYVDTLYKNSTQLNDLVKGFLDVEHTEDANLIKLNIQPVKVDDIFKRWVYVYEDVAGQHKISLVTDVEQPDLRWNTDVLCMSKIVTTLMLVIFKHTASGATVRVSEKATAKDELILQFDVSGAGFSGKSWNQIFEMLADVDEESGGKDAGDASGRDLNFAVIRVMASKLQAKIYVGSEGDELGRIRIVFPQMYVVQPLEDVQPVMPAERFNRKDDTPEILIVDDNPDILWLVSDILGSDYVITSAANGAEARRAVERQIPSLIITDMIMPDETGIDFIKFIRGNKFTRNLPVIILSAKISEEDKIEGYNAGADAYVTKPFNADFIKTLVARLLRKTADENYYRSPESAVTLDGGIEISNEGKVFFDSIRKYVSNNLDDESKLSPDAIANAMGVDIRTLYRRFKKYTPYTPSEFVKKIRYGFAANLILTTDLTIQEIIFQIGMNNKTVFYSDFKKIYGMTPKEYRNSKH